MNDNNWQSSNSVNPLDNLRPYQASESAFGENGSPSEQPVPRRERFSWARTLARYATIWLAVFLVLKFVIPSYDVKGSSMMPTYQVEGDRVLTDQLFFKAFGEPERGDIVVLSRPSAGDDALIKRVIALPGERVEVKKGIVYVNGKAIDEPYVKNKADYNYPLTTLQNGCYFVLGDNRPVSLDSHYFGCVEKENILAKVLLRYPWHP